MAANQEANAAQSATGNASNNSLPGLPAGIQLNLPAGMTLGNIDPAQLMALIRMPGVVGTFDKLIGDGGGLKEDAAQTLTHLAQLAYPSTPSNPHQPSNSGQVPIQPYPLHVSDPGSSSHPRGGPSIGQLTGSSPVLPKPTDVENDGLGDNDGRNQGTNTASSSSTTTGPNSATNSAGRSRNSNRAAMGSDEWARQRKDNHKEVERRRRGNINEGINELGRIVPSGSGEKAKGAILSRAVQYIHHLKENEARNIEKWTLEKLLMDQAMGDLQHQLEELRRMWEEEKAGRERAERELEKLGAAIPGKEDGKRRSSTVEAADENDRNNSKRMRTD